MTDFQKAADYVKEKKPDMSQEEALELYSLFKQATVGDVNIEAPGMFQMEAKAKFNAWTSKKGMSKSDAEAAYIALVKKHCPEYA